MSDALARRLFLVLPAIVAVLALMMTSSRPAQAVLDCADLVITDLTITPSSPVEDINATIDITVLNQGTCAATGFVVQWKQAQAAPTGPSQAVGGLAASASTTVSLTYAFPNSGNFQTFARVDSGFAVPESIETNNTAIEPVTVVPDATDLVVTDVIFDPEPAVSTQAMTATVRVQNTGNTAAGEFRVQWKPSPLGANQSQQVNSLAAGATIDVEFPFTYALAGTYNTTARVDVLNMVRETDERNNSRQEQLVVDPPRPDLDVTGVSISPANPVAGLPAQLTATITNVGHAPARDFQVQWKPAPLSAPLTEQVNGPLAPGASVNVVFDHTYVFGGTFNGKITADSASRILEVTEDNNTEDFPVTVSAGNVDLTITNFGFTPANPVQGENTQFSVTIQNLGNTPATNFEVSVNPDAFQIATPSMQTLTTQVDSLAGGASMVLTFDFEYPHAGNFRGIAEVDAFRNVRESNEANNKALANLVVGPASIDLDITGFTLSTDLCDQAIGFGNACSPMLFFKGSAVTASVTVTNNGSFPAGSFAVQWKPDQDAAFGPTAFVPGLLPGASTTVQIQGSFSSDGPFTSLATVDVFEQVVEPCAGCEDNNTATTSVNVLPRNTSVSLQISQFNIANDLDNGLAGRGEWVMFFLALDPTASCNISFGPVNRTVENIRCNGFSESFSGGGNKGPQGGPLNLTLTEFQPLAIALTGLEDDSPRLPEFVGFATKVFLPGDYQVAGTVRLLGQNSPDGRCPGGQCFFADITITVTQAPPPPATIGAGTGSSEPTVSTESFESQLLELTETLRGISEGGASGESGDEPVGGTETAPSPTSFIAPGSTSTNISSRPWWPMG